MGGIQGSAIAAIGSVARNDLRDEAFGIEEKRFDGHLAHCPVGEFMAKRAGRLHVFIFRSGA